MSLVDNGALGLDEVAALIGDLGTRVLCQHPPTYYTAAELRRTERGLLDSP